MYISRFIAAILGYNLLFAQDVTRKADDEAICQPFLTSPISSPLSNSPRDIPLDEEGEWACLQVLNDINLPLQIRVTIHEGLFVSQFLNVMHF